MQWHALCAEYSLTSLFFQCFASSQPYLLKMQTRHLPHTQHNFLMSQIVQSQSNTQAFQKNVH